MKKYLLILVILAAGTALLFTAPHVYERLMATDKAAAVVINSLPANQIGLAVVSCLNQKNQSGVWWDLNTYYDLRGNIDHGRPWSGSYYIVSGVRGWHTTWIALLHLDTHQVTAYETLGVKGRSGGMFMRALPSRIIGSLKRCGVAYAGVWVGELPSPFQTLRRE